MLISASLGDVVDVHQPRCASQAGFARQDRRMSGTDQIFSALVAEAGQAGEVERARFEASRGAYFGFNGTYCYVVTDSTL